jgi:hypothetical protein
LGDIPIPGANREVVEVVENEKVILIYRKVFNLKGPESGHTQLTNGFRNGAPSLQWGDF